MNQDPKSPLAGNIRLKDPAFASVSACGCVGPQNGEPVCPCMMRDVRVIDGRYMRITDLGPAPMVSGRGPMPSSRHNFIFGEES